MHKKIKYKNILKIKTSENQYVCFRSFCRRYWNYSITVDFGTNTTFYNEHILKKPVKHFKINLVWNLKFKNIYIIVIHQPQPTPKQVNGVKQKQLIHNFPETPIRVYGRSLKYDTHSKIRKVCKKKINLTSSKHHCIFILWS